MESRRCRDNATMQGSMQPQHCCNLAQMHDQLEGPGDAADLDVGCPAMVIRLPLHPSLKDLPGSWHIVQHLFHVDVLIPQLVNTRQQCDSPIPDVSCMVDEACSHFHLSILQPECYTGIADI